MFEIMHEIIDVICLENPFYFTKLLKFLQIYRNIFFYEFVSENLFMLKIMLKLVYIFFTNPIYIKKLSNYYF